MKTEFLNEFVTLAHYGNFHTAAHKLFISQPTLSNHIKALEQEVGFELFDRNRNNELTGAGSLLLDAAQSALSTIDSALESCRELSVLEKGACPPVRIAVYASTTRVFNILENYCDYPHTYVQYDMRKPTLHSFAQGLADIMVTYDIDSFPTLKAEADILGLSYEYIGVESCAIALKETHPLAHEPLTRENLRGATVSILSGVEFGYWKSALADMLGGDLGFKFKLTPMETTDTMRGFDLKDTILISMAAMVEEFFAGRDNYLARYEVDGKPLCIREGLVWRDRPENPNIAQVIALLQHHMSETSIDG